MDELFKCVLNIAISNSSELEPELRNLGVDVHFNSVMDLNIKKTYDAFRSILSQKDPSESKLVIC